MRVKDDWLTTRWDELSIEVFDNVLSMLDCEPLRKFYFVLLFDPKSSSKMLASLLNFGKNLEFFSWETLAIKTLKPTFF